MFQRCRENQNTHFVFNNYSRKTCRVWECTKYGRNRKATDDKHFIFQL